MVRSTAAMDQIAESMRHPITQYLALIGSLAGDRVQGLTFFGGVVAGVFDPARHTARNVLVMDEIDLSVQTGRRLSTAAHQISPRLGAGASTNRRLPYSRPRPSWCAPTSGQLRQPRGCAR